MAITLTSETRPAKVIKQGSTTATISGSEKVLIKAPAGDTLLDESPGTGKTWKMTINVYIEES
jgi:hypothetical protein